MKYLRFFKKWKILVFVCFICCVPFCLLEPNEHGAVNAVISSIICAVIALAPLIPDVLYIKTPAAQLWKRWQDVGGIKAEQRKERAAFGELTPVYIDPELKYGDFAGAAGGKYRTMLCSCSCPDFKRRKVPCKHMYYVAEKCGVEVYK